MGFDTTIKRLIASAFVLLISGCGLLSSGTAPEDMSAEEHMRQSEKHEKAARKHRSHYNPNVSVDPSRIGGRWSSSYDYRSGDSGWPGENYNPSENHLTVAKEHEALARKHRASAHALEQFEEAECSAFSPEVRVLCPLLGQLKSAEDIPNGSRIRFADGINVNAAVAHMRCHLAFARAQGYAGMNSCPLYLQGVEIRRDENGSDVDFLTKDPGLLKTLRSRMRLHLPQAGE